jgi:membrane-associated phospholipid phosphatase
MDDAGSVEGALLETWKRITLWVNQHERIARLGSIIFCLTVFLIFLPSYMRIAFWAELQSHTIFANLLLVFSLLAVSLVWSTGQHIDAWAFLFFNGWGPRPIWLDRLMLGFTQIGNGLTSLAIGLVLLLIGVRVLAYELILGTLSLWLAVELVKFLVHRSRPFIRLTQARIVGGRAIGRSFPSGHTSQVFFMAMLMAQHFHSSIGVVFLLCATALLVGLTRMYVGAHYPRDVLAGAILGSAWGLLAGILDGYWLSGVR